MLDHDDMRFPETQLLNIMHERYLKIEDSNQAIGLFEEQVDYNVNKYK